MTDWNLPPDEIEQRSMAIIDEEAGEHSWPPDAWKIIQRMIHTTADFDWVKSVVMSPGVIPAAVNALRAGAGIVTDTNMALSGIARKRIQDWGGRVDCLIADTQVAALAKEKHTTRAMAAVDLAIEQGEHSIFVVGNAPTALFRLIEHAGAGRVSPDLVVGLPVGFVNAAEAKEALASTSLPYITAQGRKGGSAVAASVINALTLLAQDQG